MDRRADSFCVDRELPPRLKQNWCMKSPPAPELLQEMAGSRHKQRRQLRDLRLPAPSPGDPPAGLDPAVGADAGAALVRAADLTGSLIQYRHQGFLPNARQHRMAGLAAIEMAQAVRGLVADALAGTPTTVPDAGASGGGPGRRDPRGRHAFGWRDLVDIAVRWRQVSEPNDQVVWADLLASEEFEAGFGSHTPMYTGQTKCVRYYFWAERALELMKACAMEDGGTNKADNCHVPVEGIVRERFAAAATPQEVWEAAGDDCWNVVRVASTHRPGRTLEGTRLTVVRVPHVPDGFEFSIRTPVTPGRWAEFDAELRACFDAVVRALCRLEGHRGPGGLADDAPEDAQRECAEAILLFAFYWYNFMPLVRGTAVVGYVTILGLFLAAGLPVGRYMPADEQTDWEAILERDPRGFLRAVGERWLYPPALGPRETPGEGEVAAGARDVDPDALPRVSEAFPTVRSRILTLSAAYGDAPGGP